MQLNRKTSYLQVALNSTPAEAARIIATLPKSERIILEAGTPLLKQYGAAAITGLRRQALTHGWSNPYIVADYKTFDRGETEVALAAAAGANAVTALGHAPLSTLNTFIEACENHGLDSMVDMMNVDFPLSVLRELKTKPDVVILHRGVDETEQTDAALPLYEIRRIKGELGLMIAVAGGDSGKDVQSAIFNDADIVVVWKDFYTKTSETGSLAENFLKYIK